MSFCPKCGKATPQGANFCPSCGYDLDAIPVQQPETVISAPVRSSHKARNIGATIVIVALIIIALLFVGSLAQQTAQRAAIVSIQVLSVTMSNIGVQLSGVSMSVNMEVYNPNGITATLDEVSYSVYANGNYVGSGQTTSTYNLPPQSAYTLVFPLSMSWGSAFDTVGSYILSGGSVIWEIKGTDNVNIDGVSFSVPFDFTSG